MILCLTGTNPYSFIRLVSYVDKVLGPKYNVVIQLGNTHFTPVNSEYFDFCAQSDLNKMIEEADLVITQGGYGSMTDVLTRGKMLIAVPRLIDYDECKDDQLELVNYYANKSVLVSCYDIEDLEDLVYQLLNNQISLKQFIPDSKNYVKTIIKQFLDEKVSINM